jgi:hypothetical protein
VICCSELPFVPRMTFFSTHHPTHYGDRDDDTPARTRWETKVITVYQVLGETSRVSLASDAQSVCVMASRTVVTSQTPCTYSNESTV